MNFFSKWRIKTRGKSRFLIICAARTGSTMLRLMLDSHPDVCCHDEVFDKHVIRGFIGLNDRIESPLHHMLLRIRSKDPVGFLDNYVFSPGPFSIVGAKILYTSLEDPEWKSVFQRILSDHNIKIIHLTRENKLKRFVSHYIAVRITNVKLAFTPDSIPAPVRVTLSPQECIEDITAAENAEKRFCEYFKKHQVFEITYEQVLDETSNKLIELQKFLGVAPVELKKKTLKLNPDNLADIIMNYSELQEIFHGTRYEHYLI